MTDTDKIRALSEAARRAVVYLDTFAQPGNIAQINVKLALQNALYLAGDTDSHLTPPRIPCGLCGGDGTRYLDPDERGHAMYDACECQTARTP